MEGDTRATAVQPEEVQLEEGELANLSLIDYDQLISAVGQYQIGCAQLKAPSRRLLGARCSARVSACTQA
jgi:hypothetical protein